MKMCIVFLIAVGLAAPAFGAWGPAHSGSWAAPVVPANIALSQDGRNILDTPEVAAARASHLAALAQANSQGGNSNDDGSYDSRWEAESNYQGEPAQNQWNAAPAQNQWNAAPAQNQWNAAPAQNQWNAAPTNWKHAPANIALSSDGHHVLDTPEVAQARAAHLAAHAAIQSQAAPAQNKWNAAPAQSWNAAPAQSWNAAPAPVQSWNAAPAPAQSWNAAPAQSWNAAPAQSWNAAPAQPNWATAPSKITLSHDGQNVLDTPEVQQAKAAHLAAHAAAAAGAAPAHRSW